MSTIITNDTDWLDLDVGEHAIVRGSLEHVSYRGQRVIAKEPYILEDPHITVSFAADWSTISIGCTQPRSIRPIRLGTRVSVKVRRTEDGLMALAIWEEGGVVIPLASEGVP